MNSSVVNTIKISRRQNRGYFQWLSMGLKSSHPPSSNIPNIPNNDLDSRQPTVTGISIPEISTVLGLTLGTWDTRTCHAEFRSFKGGPFELLPSLV